MTDIVYEIWYKTDADGPWQLLMKTYDEETGRQIVSQLKASERYAAVDWWQKALVHPC